MKLFSQRYGYKPVRNVIQKESMDDDLRIGLWNVFTIHYFSDLKKDYNGSSFLDDHKELETFCIKLWIEYFKKPIDTLPQKWIDDEEKIRNYFFESEWVDIYDLLEFIVYAYPNENINIKFMENCNKVLKRELSAYRFVGNNITLITSDEEITEIEEALEATKERDPIYQHLTTALELLSDKKSPNYRNSIKESISAVESLCNKINGKQRTLGQTLNALEGRIDMHGAFKSGLSNLYGWTSSDAGIRHALMDKSNLDFEDAKFMLVACSAFINYLREKARKAGIELS
jgi:hypothetical protein